MQVRDRFEPERLGTLVREYTHWNVYVSPKQYFLGKLRIVLTRSGVVDLGDLTEDEFIELHTVLQQSKRALTKAFQPDLFNYATLGNWIRQHHWHLIPRYENVRVVNNTEFRDELWNNPPWPAPLKAISAETYNQIVKELKVVI